MMTTEENILAYLDGSLGADQSAELLHRLSASPDKRRLLDEHLRLKDLIALGKRPYAVSPELERSLAARLPAIRSVEQASRPFVSATKSFSRLFAAAGALGLLTIAGMMTWYGTRPDTTSKSGLTNHTTAAISNPLVMASASTAVGQVPDNSSVNQTVISRHTTNHGGSATNLAHGLATNDAATSGFAASNLDESHSTQISNRDTRASSPTPMDNPRVVQGTPSTPPDESITTVAVADQSIPNPSGRIAHTLSEITMPEPRQTGGLGIGLQMAELQYTLPRMSSDASAQTFTSMSPGMTLSYYLSPYFALDVDLGLSQYAIVSDNSVTQLSNDLSNYARTLHSTVIDQATTTWARLGMDYTFNPESEIPFSIGASGGLAFENQTEPIVALSAGFSRILTSSVFFDLAVVATGTWGSPSPDLASRSASDVTGIVYSSVASQRTFMSAVGLRAGVKFRP